MPDTATHNHHGSYLMPSLEHATVADAMHPGILSCEPDATLSEVARMMATQHVHCVAVVDMSHEKPPHGFVWGIISDLDLVAAGIRDDTERTARDLAGQPVMSVKPSVPLRDAGELMLTHRASHLVVTDAEAGRPIGILSTLDVAGVLAWGEA
jgi:CBS domain-containing protein